MQRVYLDRLEFRWSVREAQRESFQQDAQKGHPARPQAKQEPEAYPPGYVEDSCELRTKLGAFFSILLRCDRYELQEVLARQEGVFSNEPVAGFSQFCNHGLPRDQMVFRKTEFT